MKKLNNWDISASGPRDGQDEGSEFEMVQACEEKVRNALVRRDERLDVAGARRGSSRPKKNWGGD